MAPTAVTLGSLELVPLSDGFFMLDGGAMFGVVPKPLWSRLAPADDRNRIRMGMRPLLVRGERTVLIDAYGFDRSRHLDHALADAGVGTADIDVVVASHLHFDHAGGFTARGPDGIVRPRFPRAQYIVRAGEWHDAVHPHERNRASYFDDNYVPLSLAGVLTLVEEDGEVTPGIRVRRTGGHTKHHQLLLIESGAKTAVFMADLIPTVAHVPLPWIMGYDLFPMETLEFKRAFLREAVAREYLVFFEHDPVVTAGYLRERDGRITVERVI